MKPLETEHIHRHKDTQKKKTVENQSPNEHPDTLTLPFSYARDIIVGDPNRVSFWREPAGGGSNWTIEAEKASDSCDWNRSELRDFNREETYCRNGFDFL